MVAQTKKPTYPAAEDRIKIRLVLSELELENAKPHTTNVLMTSSFLFVQFLEITAAVFISVFILQSCSGAEQICSYALSSHRVLLSSLLIITTALPFLGALIVSLKLLRRREPAGIIPLIGILLGALLAGAVLLVINAMSHSATG